MSSINNINRSSKLYGDNIPKPPMYGLYEVSDISENIDFNGEYQSIYKEWKYIGIENEGYIQIYKKDKEIEYYKLGIDTLKKSIKLLKYNDSTVMGSLSYSKKGNLTIFKTDRFTLETKKLTKDDFLLTNRGFNWINEYPLNR